MSWGMVAVAGATVVGGYMQSQAAGDAADAAGAAAGAQLAAARENKADIMRIGTHTMGDVMNYAQATPQELAALDRSFSSAERSLRREEQLLAAIDPALMEASTQALALLRGETAGMNRPMMDLRNQQRQSLLNTLRAQYGPGAETTSLGQKRLQQFDMETNTLFAQNQQNALNQAFGIAATDLGNRTTRGIASLQQVGQGYSALQERKVNARLNTGNSMMSALAGANAQMIQNAGAPYVGDALRAQGTASMWGNIANAGTTLGTAYLMGGKK